MEQKIKLRKVRPFADKINVTFDFIRQNIKPLFKSLIYIAGPVLVLMALLSSLMQINMFSGNTNEMVQSISFITLLFYVASLVSTSLMVCIVYCYMQIYQSKESLAPISVQEVWEQVKKHVFTILLTLILAGLIIMAGFIAFIIPGIILGIALSIIFPVVIFEENESFGSAFSRCFSLMKGNYLSTFGLLFVVLIIQFILSMIFTVPAMAVSGISGFLSTSGNEVAFQTSGGNNIMIIITQLISTVGSQFVSIISLIAIGFQYFNLVEKKEATGLMNEIGNLGTSEV